MTLSEHLHTSLEDLEEHFPEYDGNYMNKFYNTITI